MSRHQSPDLARNFSIRSLSILSLLLLAVLESSAAPLTQAEAATVSLELSKPIERTIAGGEAHSYTVTLAAGQYAQIVVDQRGANVVVTVNGPDGASLFEVDTPHSNYGPERVALLADSPATYRVEVESQTKASARYEIKLQELRPATQQDLKRVAAQKLSFDPKALGKQRTEQAYQQAIDKFLAANAIWRELGEKTMEAVTLHKMGLLYGDIGQYQKALDSYSQARTLYQALGNRGGAASALSNVATTYSVLGEGERSLPMYEQAMKEFDQLGDIDPILLSNIGSSYAEVGNYQRALEIHFRVLELRRAAKDKNQSITLSNIANCYRNLGDNVKALDFYSQALAMQRQGGSKYYLSAVLNNIGVVYRLLGQYQTAQDHFNEALTLRKSVGDQKGIVMTLANIAYLERDRGNLVEARKRVEEALEKVEQVRSNIGTPQLRTSFFALMQKYRELYIDLLMRLHKQNPAEHLDRLAFNASETGRARSLLQLLGEAGKQIRHGIDPALMERQRTVGDLLDEKAQKQTRLLSGKHTEEQANAAAKEISALTTEFEQLENKIRESSPQFAALVQPVPLTLEETQKQVLDPETLLLEYSLGEDKSFLWAVTTSSIKSYELPNRGVIEPLARRVYGLLTARNQSVAKETLEQRRLRLQSADAEYLKAAASLSQMLLGPAAGELKNKRLLIVSDGVLQFVPFAALPDPVNAQALMVNHEIVTAPSTSVVALLRQETTNRKPAPKTLAVFADPVFSDNDPRVLTARLAHAARDEKTSPTDAVRSASEIGVGDLRRLRFSRQEADEITRFATNELQLEAVDFKAKRALATSAELGQYRIVHFATHGLINNTHPELSGVVLSLVDEKGRPQNGFLRLYDLYNLKLSADLVVLSACQTALGKEIRGEGLVGLTRGFMYAGAPRVVASFWQIDDRATAEFMKRFYQEMLGQKLRPAAALRAAQASMSKDPRWNQPHYWAAFTLQGEWK